MDAEYPTSLGPRRATRIVDHHLKLLALLGARISVGTVILADVPSVQPLVANEGFRDFVTVCDPGFLRLEVDGDPAESAEWIARHAWRRMQVPGWVSSSRIGQGAIVAAAGAALDCGFDDKAERARFGKQIRRIAADFELSKDACNILLSTFDLLNWFATDERAVARAKAASPTTYYDKLVAALEAPRVPGSDYAVLNRVLEYVDNHVENKWERSAVLRALASDETIDNRSKAEIRATVGSAWSAANSDGSSASVSLTLPLPVGVVIPRVLDRPTEAFVDIQQIDEFICRNPVLRVQDTLQVNLAKLSWEKVAELVKETETTRSVITNALDEGREVKAHVMAAHRKALKRRVQQRFPTLTKTEVGRFAISVVSATASHGGPIRFAGAVSAGVDIMKSMWRWTRGRFVAGTLNRFANHLELDERDI